MAGPTPAQQPERAALERGTEILRLLGCRFDEISGDRVTGWLETGPQHHQPYGIVHGGVLSAVVETFASVGAWLAVRERGLVAVGVANSTDFIRSTVADTLDVEARAVHQGATQQLWEVIITRRSDGRDVARGRVRLQNVPPR